MMLQRFRAFVILIALLLCSMPSLGEAPATLKRQTQSSLSASDSAVAIGVLAARLDAAIQHAGLSGVRKSLCVYSIDNQTVYYERQSKTALTPASTTKLFSTFTAFDRFGASGTIPTKIFTDAKGIENGVLRGNIYIVGHGDALLSIGDIETLADKLVALGIKKIEGSVYADGSYFDAVTERHIYSGDGEVVEPLPPITALGMNRNSAQIIVSPGRPPRVQTIPPSDAFRIIANTSPPAAKEVLSVENNTAKYKSMAIRNQSSGKAIAKQKKIYSKTKKQIVGKKSVKRTQKSASLKRHGSKRSGAFLSLTPMMQHYGDAMPLPFVPKRQSRKAAVPRISVQTRSNESGIQEFIVSGGVGRGGMYSAAFIMKNPDIATAGALRNRLTSGGISVSGGVGRRAKPEGAVVLTVFERPLAEMCAAVNKNSDNFLAEHVFKMIGAQAGGQKNTAKRATEVVKECLEKENIYSDGLCMADGSGLCRKNLISAATEAELLNKAAKLFGGKFEATLSVAGVDGTLRRRMKSTAAEGNVRAKTGTLRNASALAGYVRSTDGERLSFSFIFNGGSVGLYKQTENKLAEILADFSYADAKIAEPQSVDPKPAKRLHKP